MLEKRNHIAAQAKQNMFQEVLFNPNKKPVANIEFQSFQINATPLCQSTPTIGQHPIPIVNQQNYSNAYLSNSNPYLNAPPMPVNLPPVQFNPPMPEPTSVINAIIPVTLHGRLGQTRKNPIVEH